MSQVSALKLTTDLHTDLEKVQWYYWKLEMTKSENWFEHKYPNKTIESKICYECSNELTNNRWMCNSSYEIILDNVVRNIYCNDCHLKWLEYKVKL
jgi:hypothetical protein